MLGPTGATRFARWLKFAPGEFVILGILPATLRVALRSKIAPGDYVNFRPLPPEDNATQISFSESTTLCNCKYARCLGTAGAAPIVVFEIVQKDADLQ